MELWGVGGGAVNRGRQQFCKTQHFRRGFCKTTKGEMSIFIRRIKWYPEEWVMDASPWGLSACCQTSSPRGAFGSVLFDICLPRYSVTQSFMGSREHWSPCPRATKVSVWASNAQLDQSKPLSLTFANSFFFLALKSSQMSKWIAAKPAGEGGKQMRGGCHQETRIIEDLWRRKA